ncbi:SfnB family sulfur acquisition oxidoreductase [Tsukamurella ocularis]|uniref:SfnB family sulfur acquisition oxidoreductase n=1 Tax=Tsukamurella ocularis TaxID=1970234 RepID=UPI0021698FE8|nr:SfnB family sulfur acquisition oxidoreductase [Tsukamurella ocularis]MCS3780496.1 SfnB family sulfur acquisition oxidoreductase [Tsukamurella ocularis]MCS3785949.1 SfnB family sulfur acquisition oxidoreductase [Tsukamurella ocularis]MCS3849313.1 SfnB family sulfur acquisition oxidoreductase [Tsukamurella ocularis]
MTLAAAIDSAEAAVTAARELAARLADGAGERDRERRLPHAEVEYLSDAGLFALTVPARFGGPDLPPSVVAEVFRTLATVDGSLAQIPHSHYVYLTALRLAGPEELQRRIFEQVLDGARVANAQSERGGRTVADVATTLTRTPDGAHLDGEKFYCTGSPYAHLLAVLARDTESGEHVIAFVPADTPGIAIADDWNGLGQRTTGSGTVRFNDVAVPLDAVVARSSAVAEPTGYGAFAQLLHVAIDAGIARGSLEVAAEFVRTKSRPWFEAGVDRAQDDPLVIQRFGELTVTVRAAEAALVVAAQAVDATFDAPGPDTAAEASLAVATAKVLADRAATEVPSALFEVSGTRSAGGDSGLDRYWRDARTHTLHDPVRYKVNHLGRFTLNEERPPLHGVI